MKIGSIREFKVTQGANAGKTVYSRTVWMQPGERQPSPLDLAELQDALQASHPGQLVSVQTRISAFAPMPPAETEADDNATT
jgi:hypothetical protein